MKRVARGVTGNQSQEADLEGAGAGQRGAGVLGIAVEFPAYGQQRALNELRQKEGVLISQGGIRSVLLRNDLETLPKRLKALEAKVAQDGVILSEAQLAALEKQGSVREAHGEIESEHSGYRLQYIYYVGTIKGVGCIYR